MVYNISLYSEYSMFDSLISIDALVTFLKNENIDIVSITDCNNMYGSYKLYQKCQKANIKAVFALEFALKEEPSIKLLGYAVNHKGYLNLLNLATIAKHQPLFLQDLKQYSSDLIVVIKSRSIDYLKKYRLMEELNNTFDEIFIGISKEQIKFMPMIVELNRLNLRCVAVNDIRYLNDDDKKAFITLKAMEKNTTIKNINSDFDYHYLRKDELEEIYHDYPELLKNTNYIFNKANVSLTKNTNIIPKYNGEFDSNKYLESIAVKGLNKRLGNVPNIYYERLNKELKVIEKLNYADYFLIVWDYVKYAKRCGILVGPGRGSAASSLVSYSLGITNVDPIKYQLLFERFLNEERITMPDIDIDFPDDRRDEIIKYVQQKYGELRVSHISTFSTFGLKSTIKDVSKVLGLTKIKEEELLKAINDTKEETIAEFLALDKIKNLCNDYQDIKNAVDIISKICELPRALSTHAAGIIIASSDLTNFTPLDLANDGIYQTQYDAYDLESIGLLKMDFLSLRNLNIIDRMVKLIRSVDEKFNLPIEFNDSKTFNVLSKALTYGIFQFESDGMKKMLLKMGIDSFEDLAQAMALNRPGPLSMMDLYVERKKGLKPIEYIDSSLANILKPTRGIILFQEQIILILCKYANYSLGEADVVRRAISKKQRDVMENERERFVTSAIKAGNKKEIAEEIFNYIEKFADYGFPRAHSISYSMIAYYMAYIKANYPKAFYAVMMDDLIGSSSFDAVIKELKQFNIKLLNPNINLSSNNYLPTTNGLLMPLSQIKGVGKAYGKMIIEEREKGEFQSFMDFINRLGKIIPVIVIENLVFSSAFDDFNISKKAMIENITKLIERSKYSFVAGISKIEFDSEEYGYGYLLNKEKEVINVNIKYDYFLQYQKLYQKKIVTEIKNINNKQTNLKILCKILKISTITTKNKELMAFMNVADATGEMSVVVFPRQYELIKNLKTDMVLIIEGVLRIKDNGEKELIMDNYRQV